MRSTVIGLTGAIVVALACVGMMPATAQAAAVRPRLATAAAAGGDYVPVGPARLMDTRPGGTTVDGQNAGTGALGSGTTVNLTVAGRAGVPTTGVLAVALNVTGTNPTAGTYVTAWPAGQPQPVASNVNLVPGQTAPSAVVVELGSAGQVSLFNHAGSTDLIVDVVGYFPTGNDLVPGVPRRLMDTRSGSSTFDGQQVGGGALAPNSTVNVQVDGRAFAAAPAGATAVLNVTGTDPTDFTYLTAWPAGQPRPVASNVNLVPGQTSPNVVLVPVGTNGQVSIYNHGGSTDVVVDLLAVAPVNPSIVAVPPARLLDTRAGQSTVDGNQSGTGAFGGGESRSLPVAGRGGVPGSGVTAVAVNITGTNPTAGTYVTAWPSGTRPLASNLNLAPGETRAVLALVGLGSNGAIQLYNNGGSTDLIVDVLGYFTNNAPPPPPLGSNGFEGCTAGQPVTVANSAAGGTPFSTVDTGVGVPQYSTAIAAHGTCSITLTGSVSTTGKYATWNNVVAPTAPLFVRAYIRMTALPSGTDGTVRFMRFSTGAQIGGYVAVNDNTPGPQGTVALEDGDTAHLGLSTTVLNINTWYRIEVEFDNTTQSMTGRLYLGDSTTLLEQWSGPGATFTNTDFGVGQEYDAPNDNGGNFFIDDVAYGTNWLGPA